MVPYTESTFPPCPTYNDGKYPSIKLRTENIRRLNGELKQNAENKIKQKFIKLFIYLPTLLA